MHGGKGRKEGAAVGEEHRIRTCQFKVTLLPEEKAMLDFRASEFGLSKTEFLRKLILADTLMGSHRTMDKEQAEKLIYHVGKIGTNINQIAYNTNVKAYTTKDDYERLYRCFFDLLDVVANIPYFEIEEREKWQQRISMLLQQL